MAEVTGLTAERMLAIEGSSVVSGAIDGSGHLILTKHDGSTVDAGYALVAVPDDVIVNYLDPVNFNETTPVTGYPAGISLMWLSNTETTADWPSFAGKWGTLRTIHWSGAGDTNQVWSRLHGASIIPEQWIRSGNSAAGWSNWKKLALTDEVTSVQSSLTSSINTVASNLSNHIAGTILGDGVNLDTISATGLYTQAVTSQAASGTNYPEALAGSLEVMNVGNGIVTQRYIPYGNNADRFWIRSYSGSSWSFWKLYTSTAYDDTGWQNLGVVAGFNIPGGFGPRYRRRNGILYMDGFVTGNFGTYGSWVTCCTLPAGFRPVRPQGWGASANTTVTLSVTVQTSGLVQVYASASTTAWIGLNVVTFPLV